MMKPPKKRGRPPGSVNQPKMPTLGFDLPKAVALKIANLSAKTGVNQERIALCALVDGLKKWEGIHEVLINYNESVNTIIRAAIAGPNAKKKTILPLQADAKPSAEPRQFEFPEETQTFPRADRAGESLGGATHLTPDDNAVLGRGELEPGNGTERDVEQITHGE